MRTLKAWWSFANDATKLSDAEQVAKGEENWSPLASDALNLAANIMWERASGDESWTRPVAWALENHPQAFEELSLAIGAALEAMWRVVPEAKGLSQEEFEASVASESCSNCGPVLLGAHQPGCGAVCEVVENGSPCGKAFVPGRWLCEVHAADCDRRAEEAKVTMRLRFFGDGSAIQQQINATGGTFPLAQAVGRYPIVYAGAWHDETTVTPHIRRLLNLCPGLMRAAELEDLQEAGYRWNEANLRWEHLARIER